MFTMYSVLKIGVWCLLLGLYASVPAAGQGEGESDSSKAVEEKKETPTEETQQPKNSSDEEAGKAAKGQDEEGGKKEGEKTPEKSEEEEVGGEIGTQLPFDLNVEPGSDKEEQKSEKGGGFQSDGWTLRYVVSMLVVLGVMGGVLYALRKVRTRLTQGTAAERGVRIVGKFPLDRRNNVVLLRIQNEDLLIASGNEGARLLARYPAKEESTDGDTEEEATFTLYSTNNRT